MLDTTHFGIILLQESVEVWHKMREDWKKRKKSRRPVTCPSVAVLTEEVRPVVYEQTYKQHPCHLHPRPENLLATSHSVWSLRGIWNHITLHPQACWNTRAPSVPARGQAAPITVMHGRHTLSYTTTGGHAMHASRAAHGTRRSHSASNQSGHCSEHCWQPELGSIVSILVTSMPI